MLSEKLAVFALSGVRAALADGGSSVKMLI